MALFRREKTWTVEAGQAAVREAVRGALARCGIRITADGSNVIEGRSGSGFTSFMFWNDRTAPYRVRVALWEATDGGVVSHQVAFVAQITRRISTLYPGTG